MQYPPSSSETGMDREDRAVLRSVDDLLPDLKYLLPRCDAEITMRKALAEAAQAFCRKTGALEYTAVIPVVDGRFEYDLPVSDVNADLLNVKRIEVWELPAGETVERRAYLLSQRAYDVLDPIDDDKVTLRLGDALYVGTSTLNMRVVMSLIPYYDQSVGAQAYSLPDKFLRRWRQAIVCGAAAALANMDGRPWVSKSLASDMNFRYYELVNEATEKADYNRMVSGSASCVNPTGFV